MKRIKKLADKYWADEYSEENDSYIAGYRQAIEDAAKVADDNAHNDSRWMEHYKNKEPNKEMEMSCGYGAMAARDICNEIRELLDQEEE